jgi:S1-C subfamily serine protease
MVDASRWSGKYTAVALIAVLGFLPTNLYLLYSLQSYIKGRGQLGVVVGDAPGGGTLVCASLPGGAAAKAGVRAGDVVREANDTATGSATTMVDFIDGQVRGAVVRLTIDRGGRIVRTAATVEPLPVNSTPGQAGVALADADPGAVVTGVDPGGPAQRTGLTVGDQIVAVDGVATCGSSTIALYLIHCHDPSTAVVLGVDRNGRNVQMRVVLATAAQ